MPQRPTSKPYWATDVNYPAGAEPEAGSPTKITPTIIARGWRPGEHPRAEHLNDRLNLTGQWMDWLDAHVVGMSLFHENWIGFRESLTKQYDLRSIGVVAGSGLVGGDHMTAGEIFRLHVDIPPDSILYSWVAYVNKTTNASNTVTGSMFRRALSTTGLTAVGVGASNSANNPGIIALAESNLNFDIGSNLIGFYVTGSAFSGGGGEIPIGLQVSYSPPNPRWFESTLNGGTITPICDSTDDRPGVWMQLLAPGDAAAYAYLSTRDRFALGPWPDGGRAQLEFAVDATDIAGTDDYVLQVGFMHDEGSEASTEDQIKIYKDGSSANWMFRTSDSPSGPQQETDTTVAATGVQRFRVEIFGADAVGGYRILLYINDTLRATHTTHLPAGQAMTLGAFYRNDETIVTTKSVYLSPITYTVDFV